MKKKTIALLIILLAGILAVAGYVIGFYGSTLLNTGIGALTGKLTPPLVNLQQDFEVHFGGLTVAFAPDQLKDGANLPTPVQLGDLTPIKVAFSNDSKLLVSAEVRDQSGVTIAKIVNNDWSVNNNPIIANDRNYNDYAFEVIDSNRIPVLQVYVQGDNKIYVNGLFYVGNTRILAAGNTIMVGPSDSDIRQYLTPIFKYPSNAPNPVLGWSLIVIGPVLGSVFATILFMVGYDKWKAARRRKPKPHLRTSERQWQKAKTKTRTGFSFLPFSADVLSSLILR